MSIVPFEVRNLTFPLSPARARFWVGGRKAVTAFWDMLSIFFPEGERFFIESVNAHRQHVTDPALQQAVQKFCGQEGVHRREHARYNETLAAFGYPVEEMERRVSRVLNVVRFLLPKRLQLAVTVSLEHFTALLGELVLTSRTGLAGADPEVAKLWRWHSLEENEHKAVAFDVYRAAGGGYVERCVIMLLTSLIFWGKVVEQQARMMWADGTLFRLSEHADLFRYLFRNNDGGMQRLLPKYLSFFRRDFHPFAPGDTEQLEQWRAQLADLDSMAASSPANVSTT
ncbi:MAG: metal-dependent hydrolase [Myxococcaceae bacterium]|nr:metal-dependent hydrolase [Myxococcaceae bacterium]